MTDLWYAPVRAITAAWTWMVDHPTIVSIAGVTLFVIVATTCLHYERGTDA